MSTHPYFTKQARARLRQAGGDPTRSDALAAWAEQARQINDPDRGVIVAETGELVAQTRYYREEGTYVAREDAARYGLDVNEVGLAIEALARITGQRLVHVKMSEVCTGASQFIPEA